MRKPTRRNPARAQVSNVSPLSAPVRGWNARDSIAAMAPDEAYILTNWFPQASQVVHRLGSAEYATGVTSGGNPALAETLAVYNPPSGSAEMYAWAGTVAYEVTAAGAVGAAVLSSLTNARWQTVNATTSGGNFLLAVNGADSLRLYDGTTWTAITGVSTPAITGVATTALIHLNVHQNRVWYIEKDKLDAWYTAAGAITGAVTKFPLGGVFHSGGYLVAMGTWTLDAGDGSDDRAVFVSSEGEAAVYQGTDPASAATWQLVGVYQIGKPIGRRCLLKLGGDLMILTTDGVISASQYLVTGRTDKSVAVTDRIQTAVADAVGLYDNNFGWDLTFFPNGSMLLLNVPVSDASEQFVMNTITGAWCRFTEWDAECFAVFNGDLYFGLLGEVRKAWSGTSDVGETIDSDLVQAFNYFDSPFIKHFKAAQPILGWDVNPVRIRMDMNVDFKVLAPSSEITLPSSATVLIWDTGRWDVNTWGGAVELQQNWYTISGQGVAGALHMQVSSDSAVIQYSACNVMWERGAGI